MSVLIARLPSGELMFVVQGIDAPPGAVPHAEGQDLMPFATLPY